MTIHDSSSDSPLDSQFVVHWSRSRLVFYSEIFFAFLIFMLGIVEILLFEQWLTGTFMLFTAIALIFLALEYYFGLYYNCLPLLICHTIQAVLLTLVLAVSVIFLILYSGSHTVTKQPFRSALACQFATMVIFTALFATFGASSFNRAKELEGFNRSQREYFKKLVLVGLQAANEANPEEEGEYRFYASPAH